MRSILATWITLMGALLLLGAAFQQDPTSSFLPPPPTNPRGHPVTTSRTAEELCQKKVEAALEGLSLAKLTFREERDEIGGYGLWRFEGISGRLDQRQIDQRGGPIFDVLQVFTAPGEYLWAAVGVTIPSHYFVHDEVSWLEYQQQGHANEPYYLSLVRGLESSEQIQDALQTPGTYRLSLSLNGAHATLEGVDWEKCLPTASDICQVGNFVDRLMDSGNTDFIETGTGSRHPFYGFITFQIALLERVDLCASR